MPEIECADCGRTLSEDEPPPGDDRRPPQLLVRYNCPCGSVWNQAGGLVYRDEPRKGFKGSS